ncbi:MAG: FAD-binding oxidoreductase, partial [Pedobacter sp.]
MNFTKITPDILAEIKLAIGEENVFTDAESLDNYSHDETEDLRYQPEIVVKPVSPEDISAILKICNAHHVPVTPRGGGTG